MILDQTYGYWIYFSLLYLIFLSWQDIRKDNRIDERKNYFMTGLTISLISHFAHSIWYLLAVTVFITLFFIVGAKLGDKLGIGDIQGLSWVFLGWALLDVVTLVFYVVFLLIISGIYLLMAKYLFKAKRIPLFPAILASFVTNVWWFKAW